MRKKTLVGLLLLVIVGTLSGAGYTGAAAQLRTADERRLEGSRIYWSQFVDLNFSASRIVVANIHGRQLHGLTHPAAGVHDIDPKVSPDGSRVLFER